MEHTTGIEIRSVKQINAGQTIRFVLIGIENPVDNSAPYNVHVDLDVWTQNAAATPVVLEKQTIYNVMTPISHGSPQACTSRSMSRGDNYVSLNVKDRKTAHYFNDVQICKSGSPNNYRIPKGGRIIFEYPWFYSHPESGVYTYIANVQKGNTWTFGRYVVFQLTEDYSSQGGTQ